MPRATGRPLVASGPTVAASGPAGAALAAGARLDLRRWRALVLLTGATAACSVALALWALPSPSVPGAHPLGPDSRAGLQSHVATRLPFGLAAAASGSIGEADRGFWPVRDGGSLLTRGGGIHGTFTAAGARLRVAQGMLGLSLAAVGYGRHIERIGALAPSSAASRVVYRNGAISEFYRNGPYGLEQGFTLARRPQAGTGGLVLTLKVGGSLIPQQVGSQILFRTRAGATVLRYGQLSAQDATGRRLPAVMQLRNGTLQLWIDDSHARYPLRVDPFIQQGSELTGTGETGNGGFGSSVALSVDGNTALIGGDADNGGVGAAWVFTRSGTTWTQQGPKLTGVGESGDGEFGGSVALSADGSTALIGGPADNFNGYTGQAHGAAWVFTRSGSTWTQQGSKLTGAAESGDGTMFGSSVALSADGNTALIGGFSDDYDVGAAWVFTRSGTTWTQQGPKLTAADESGYGQFGYSVALSADGNTALIGGFYEGVGVGAAWVFTRSGTTWTQQGSKLTGAGESGDGYFGCSVALSADGNTALIGGFYEGAGVGAAWVFTRSGTTWTQQGSKLTDTGGAEEWFGYSVALSGDGNTALIGGLYDTYSNYGIGAAWVFTRSGTTWTQQGSKLTGTGESGEGWFGDSVALSGDGNTALIGGRNDNDSVGAAWAFGAPPLVSSVSPASGTVNGGTPIRITGTNFVAGATVEIGQGNGAGPTAIPASEVDVVSPTEITAVTGGPAKAGTWNLFVIDSGGTSPANTGDGYTYADVIVSSVSPASGTVNGGTPITITGTGFVAGATVEIGQGNGPAPTAIPASEVVVVSPTEITAVTGDGAKAGTWNLFVVDSGGTSLANAGDDYTYAGPTVASVSPASGTVNGGTPIRITGTNFVNGATVEIGQGSGAGPTAIPASEVDVVSPTEITAVTGGPAKAGTWNLFVIASGGTSPANTGDDYTYR